MKWFHDSPADRRMSAAAKRTCVSSAVFLAAFLWVLPSRAQTSLAEAYHVIASKSFVDLTHAFGPDTPVWSGFGQARMNPAIDPKTHKPYRPAAAQTKRCKAMIKIIRSVDVTLAGFFVLIWLRAQKSSRS